MRGATAHPTNLLLPVPRSLFDNLWNSFPLCNSKDELSIDDNRLQFQIELRSENEEKPLLIKVETEINLKKGRQITIIETVVTVNEEQVAPQFVEGIIKNLNQRLDLRNAGR